MKKILVPLIALIAILLPSVTVLASDVTDADYLTEITVSNNSTSAKSGVVAVLELNTGTMIDLGMLDAAATEAAMHLSGAIDTAFMFGNNSTNPICIFIPSATATSSSNYYLYTKGITGGKIRYFPGSTGMTVADAPGIELADNFSLLINGAYLKNTGYIANKENAVSLIYDAPTDNVTGIIWKSDVIYKQETVASQQNVYEPTNWRGQTFTVNQTTIITGMSFQGYKIGTPGIIAVALRSAAGNLPVSGSAANLTSGWTNGDNLTVNVAGEWREVTFEMPVVCTANGSQNYALVLRAMSGTGGADCLMWRHDNSNTYSGGQGANANADVWAAQAALDYAFRIHGTVIEKSVTATGVTEGEHDIKTSVEPALDFVRTNNDYVSVPDSANLSMTTGAADIPFSVLAWVNFDDATNNTIVAKSETGGTKFEWSLDTQAADRMSFHCFIAGGASQIYINTPADATITNTQGYWTQFTATYDGSKLHTGLSLYMNGVPIPGAGSGVVGSYTGMTNTSSNMTLGALLSTVGVIGSELDGKIQEVKIYRNKELTAAEVLNDYNGIPTNTNVEAWYKMDEGAGNPQDSSGYAHHGTNLGADWTTGSFNLYVDDELEAITTGAEVPNTTNNYYIGDDDVTPYFKSASIDIGGVETANWTWSYNTIFPDGTGNGYDATPTFRGVSSDADVTAVIASQTASATQGEPAIASTGGWNMIGTLPATPSELFTEGGTTFPGAAEINTLATDLRTPYESIMYPIAFGLAGLAGAGVYAATHKIKMGVKGSLFLMFLTIEGVLMIFVFGGGGVISGFVLIPIGIILVALLMIRNPQSPVVG